MKEELTLAQKIAMWRVEAASLPEGDDRTKNEYVADQVLELIDEAYDYGHGAGFNAGYDMAVHTYTGYGSGS